MSNTTIIPEAVPLLQKSLDHIHHHPEEWDQADWRSFRDLDTGETFGFKLEASDMKPCGTVGCLAGWVVTFSSVFTDTPDALFVEDDRGLSHSIGSAAIRLLTGDWANPVADFFRLYEDCFFGETGLFYAGNTQRQLWHKANELCGGLLTIPPEMQ